MAYTLASGASARKGVWVQVPPSAPFFAPAKNALRSLGEEGLENIQVYAVDMGWHLVLHPHGATDYTDEWHGHTAS